MKLYDKYKYFMFTSKKLSKKSSALTPASRAKAPCLARPGGQKTLNATPPEQNRTS